MTKSNLEEVNVFLHEVHTDLESYIKKNNRVHEHFTVEQGKVVEDQATLIKELRVMQELTGLLTKALIIMSEASQIEHALLKQDEVDRNEM